MGIIFHGDFERNGYEIINDKTEREILKCDFTNVGFSGISVTYNQSTKRLKFVSWYDGNCLGDVCDIPLDKFLKSLEIK